MRIEVNNQNYINPRELREFDIFYDSYSGHYFHILKRNDGFSGYMLSDIDEESVVMIGDNIYHMISTCFEHPDQLVYVPHDRVKIVINNKR